MLSKKKKKRLITFQNIQFSRSRISDNCSRFTISTAISFSNHFLTFTVCIPKFQKNSLSLGTIRQKMIHDEWKARIRRYVICERISRISILRYFVFDSVHSFLLWFVSFLAFRISDYHCVWTFNLLFEHRESIIVILAFLVLHLEWSRSLISLLCYVTLMNRGFVDSATFFVCVALLYDILS